MHRRTSPEPAGEDRIGVRACDLRPTSFVETNSNNQGVGYSVSLSGGGDTSGTESVLGTSEDVLGVLLSTGSGGVSTLGLERPVVSAHLTGVMGTEAGSGISSLLSVEVLLSRNSGESVSLRSASTLGGGSSCHILIV